MTIKAVLFDLYGTLTYVENPVSEWEASEFLVRRGYEVYPQAYKAAWQFVTFIDYPRFGYKMWESYLKRVLELLGQKPDDQTLRELSKLYEKTTWKLYHDVESALIKTKDLGLKTAIVTTIARFKFRKAIEPVSDKIDLLVDGYTFCCEKSNPKIYLRTLKTLGVRARETVMIGDDIQLDIMLPKRVGMRAILLDRKGKLSGEKCEGPDSIVNNLNQALDIIETWL